MESCEHRSMPLSPYVAKIRARIGHDLLLLPAVSAAVFDPEGRILMARHTDDGRWSPIGGGLEPDEDPASAVVREVAEEVGLAVVVDGLIGVYGGPDFRMTTPTGTGSPSSARSTAAMPPARRPASTRTTKWHRSSGAPCPRRSRYPRARGGPTGPCRMPSPGATSMELATGNRAHTEPPVRTGGAVSQ